MAEPAKKSREFGQLHIKGLGFEHNIIGVSRRGLLSEISQSSLPLMLVPAKKDKLKNCQVIFNLMDLGHLKIVSRVRKVSLVGWTQFCDSNIPHIVLKRWI